MENGIMKNKVQAEVICRGNACNLKIIFSDESYTVYSDLTRDREALEAFASAVNKGSVSPLHIEEMIEDFIG